MFVINYDVVGISVKPIVSKREKLEAAKDGRTPVPKYFLSVLPTNPEDAKYNPEGRFAITYDQLEGLASTRHGISNIPLFNDMLNEGECSIAIPCEECKKGEDYIDQDGNVQQYTKDWYKFDILAGSIEWSAEAIKLKHSVAHAVHVQNMKSEFDEQREAANLRRQQAYRRLLAATKGKVPELADGEKNETEEPATPAPKTAKK